MTRKQCERCGKFEGNRDHLFGDHSPFCTALPKCLQVVDLKLCGQGFLMTHADGSQSLQYPDGTWSDLTYWRNQPGKFQEPTDPGLPDMW